MFKIGINFLLSLSFCLASAAISLPDDQFLPGWKRDGDVRTFQENDLYGHINGGAELFLEFGFRNLSVQNYINGDDEITIEIYQMSDPEAALGIYLMKKGFESAEQAIKARNSTNRYQIIAAKGDFYIQINNFSGKEDLSPTLIHMANYIVNQLTDQPLKIFDILPADGLIRGTERIIRGPFALQPIYTFGEGDVLSLSRSIQAVYAEYRDSQGIAYRIIQIRYKDMSAAQDAFKYLKNNLDALIKIQKETDSDFIFKDYNQKFGQVYLSDQSLGIIFNRQYPPPAG